MARADQPDAQFRRSSDPAAFRVDAVNGWVDEIYESDGSICRRTAIEQVRFGGPLTA